MPLFVFFMVVVSFFMVVVACPSRSSRESCGLKECRERLIGECRRDIGRLCPASPVREPMSIGANVARLRNQDLSGRRSEQACNIIHPIALAILGERSCQRDAKIGIGLLRGVKMVGLLR